MFKDIMQSSVFIISIWITFFIGSLFMGGGKVMWYDLAYITTATFINIIAFGISISVFIKD